MKRTLSWLSPAQRKKVASFFAFYNSQMDLDEAFETQLNILPPQKNITQTKDSNSGGDAGNSTSNESAGRTESPDIPEENNQPDQDNISTRDTYKNPPLTNTNKQQENKTRTDKILSAVFSLNTLITFLGFNFAYIIIHALTLWSWNLLLSTVVITSPWVTIPVVLYSLIALWQTHAVIQKNLLYQEKKNQYIKKYNLILKELGSDEYAKYHEQLQFINLHKKFTTENKRLIDYYNLQIKLEPQKKFTRALFMLTILSGLSIATVVTIASLGFVLLAITVGLTLLGFTAFAGAVAWLDLEAQKTELKHELKLRFLQWASIEAARVKVEALSEKKVTPTFTRKVTPTFTKSASNEVSVIEEHWVNWDNRSTRAGINSGYLALGFASMLGLHLVVGPVALIAIIAVTLIYAYKIINENLDKNNSLYEFYRAQEKSLLDERALLVNDLKILKHNYTYIKTNTPDHINHLSTASKWKLKISEAVKKSIRPFFIIGTLGAAFGLTAALLGTGLILALAIVGAIILGTTLAYVDYNVRAHKERIESKINDLRDENLFLLTEKAKALNALPEKIITDAFSSNEEHKKNNHKIQLNGAIDLHNVFINGQQPTPTSSLNTTTTFSRSSSSVSLGSTVLNNNASPGIIARPSSSSLLLNYQMKTTPVSQSSANDSSTTKTNKLNRRHSWHTLPLSPKEQPLDQSSFPTPTAKTINPYK